MAFLTKGQLKEIGIEHGENVLISDKASIYGGPIRIGNNVRIDDYCILSGMIILGDHIHIGAYCGLYGKFGIIMEDFTGLSPRCTIFSATDDFGGDHLISPMNPSEYCNVTGGKVLLRTYSQIGAGTVIMPNLMIGAGAAIGAMSFVKHEVPDWEIWAGNPLRFIKDRKQGLLEKAQYVL